MRFYKKVLITAVFLFSFSIIPFAHAPTSVPASISSSGTISEIPPIQYELAIEVRGSGDTNPSPSSYTYDEGSQVSIDALPGSGWRLSYWLLDGEDIGSADPYTVTMDDNHNLTAVFAIETSHPNLYVDGSVIKDSSGNPVRLQGFNTEEIDLGDNSDEEGFAWMNSRGFNYLRVQLFWHRLQPSSQGSWDSTYLGRLDNLVSWCQEYHIYATLEFAQWHWSPYFESGTGFPNWVITQSGGGYSSSERSRCGYEFWTKSTSAGVWMRERWMEFWLYIINRYKDNPYVVAYEIFNEPTVGLSAPNSAQQTAIMDAYEEWTQTVRAIDPDRIIIYHDIMGDFTAPYPERPVSFPNIVWTRSLYPAYESLSRVAQLKAKYNTYLGTPYIISEIGIQSISTSTLQEVRDFLDSCRSQLNGGYEHYAWYLYGRYDSTYRGYITPRNGDGSDKAIVSVLQEYM